MRHTPSILFCSLLSLGAGCTQYAYAEVSAQATLSVRSWQLIDLDPNDGITPWIHFTSFQMSRSSDLFVNQLDGRRRDYQHYSESSANTDWDIQSSFLGHLQENHYNSNGGGSLSSTTYLQEGGQSFAALSLKKNFVLSPKTLLVLKGSIYSKVFSPQPQSFEQHAYVFGSVSLTSNGGNQNAFTEFESDSYYGASGIENIQNFKIGYTNAETSELSGLWSMRMQSRNINNYQNVPDVPEAQSWAMLSGGLLFCAYALRRRKSRI